MDAARLARNGVAHQCDDGADTDVPAHCVVEVERVDIEPTVLDEINLAEGVGEWLALAPNARCRTSARLGIIVEQWRLW